MKASVFSADSMSFDVLRRCLAEMSVDAHQARDQEALSLDAGMIFLDFDHPDAPAVAVSLVGEATVIAIASVDAKARVPEALTPRMLTKPFGRDQVAAVVRGVLLDSTQLDDSTRSPAPASPGQQGDSPWQSLVARMLARKQELTDMLTASPQRIRLLLTARAEMDAEGMPRIAPEAFPLRSVLICEEDPAFAQIMARYLANKCVLQVDMATTGKEAWARCSGADYDLVILSWELKEPTGLALYNRLRVIKRTRHQAVLVTSKRLENADFRLLDEDFAATLLQKPFQEKPFALAIEKVVANALVCREFREDLIAATRESVSAGRLAQDVGGQEALDPLVLDGLRVAGDRLFEEGRPGDAEAVFATAWRLGDRRLSLLTGHAKASHALGKTDRAYSLLTTADVLAPRSVERLCLLGEVELFRRRPGEAREYFTSILAIDGDFSKAKAGIEVANAMEETAGEIDDGLPIKRFASYLNLVGITMSRGGRIDAALRYYRSAMAFIRAKDVLAKLWFNVGICCLRGKRSDDARRAFELAFNLSGGTMQKAAKYLGDDAALAADAHPDEKDSFERF